MKIFKLVFISLVVTCVVTATAALAAGPTKLPPPLLAAGPTKLPPPLIAAGPTKLPPPFYTELVDTQLA
jgi:hypothetical protein